MPETSVEPRAPFPYFRLAVLWLGLRCDVPPAFLPTFLFGLGSPEDIRQRRSANFQRLPPQVCRCRKKCVGDVKAASG